MTNFVKNWKNFLTEDLLIESRFSDALAYAQNFKKGAKQYRVKDVFDQLSDAQINTLMRGAERAIEYAKESDPSGDNKYLMWVARYLRKDTMRRFQKYSKNWGTNPMSLSDDVEPDEMVANVADLIVDKVISLTQPIKNYHLLKQKGLMKKDIYDYDPTTDNGEFKLDVSNAMRKLKDRDEQDKLKKQAAGEADDLLETEDYAVIRPNTEGASCYYGWGTKWCISARESRNYFNQYSGEGKTFYFVMFRHLPNSSPYKKVALVYGKDQGGDTEPEQVFDATDDETGEIGLIEGITENLLYRVFRKSDVFAKTRNKIKGLKSEEDRNERLDGMKDMIARMIEDPTEDDIPDETVLKIANYLFPDTYSEVIDLEIQPLQEKFDELIQEAYNEITGNAAYHNEENPGGPKHDDYEKVFDQYAPFNNIYVNYDEYDTNSWYWEASFRIAVDDPHFEDLKIDSEYTDISEFADVIHKAVDSAGIYPDEVEGDGYDAEVNVRLTPDYDETQGVDGFERFLSRMRDVDEIIESEDFWDTLSTALMDSELTAGGLKELEDELDKFDFKNVEYEVRGKEFNLTLELDPKLARPKGISGLYFGRMINTFTGAQLAGPKLGDPEVGSAPSLAPSKATNIANAIGEDTLSKVEQAIEDKYEIFYKQLTLPGLAPDASAAEPLDSLPLIDLEFTPRPDKIDLRTPGTEKVPFASKERDKGGAGINIDYPYDLVLKITNKEYWETAGADEDELNALIAFIKWIDQDKIKDQIEAMLQGTLNDAVLKYMKDNPQQTAKDLEKRGTATHFADVEDEPQVAELYKRWGKMIK
jgi:hypothetical protein